LSLTCFFWYSFSAIRLSAELKSKKNRPTPKVCDKQGKSSSTVPEKTSQGQEDSQPSVAAMKAMFDKKESPTIGRSLGNRPSPSPKPGSKVRSVNELLPCLSQTFGVGLFFLLFNSADNLMAEPPFFASTTVSVFFNSIEDFAALVEVFFSGLNFVTADDESVFDAKEGLSFSFFRLLGSNVTLT
jgi:hypothetical protein